MEHPQKSPFETHPFVCRRKKGRIHHNADIPLPESISSCSCHVKKKKEKKDGTDPPLFESGRTWCRISDERPLRTKKKGSSLFHQIPEEKQVGEKKTAY
ncbi:hypothetical protein CEXT_352571 [Caerostris extrusa]|uniref:Uncharacterized protein n=1 Tax=Caerostris extrusa TaxID=172846 RepID=A0AAV4NXV7_CAEEX|nr:hypothetical protein CEXT_352571 [Caerostris extrusa]